MNIPSKRLDERFQEGLNPGVSEGSGKNESGVTTFTTVTIANHLHDLPGTQLDYHRRKCFSALLVTGSGKKPRHRGELWISQTIKQDRSLDAGDQT